MTVSTKRRPALQLFMKLLVCLTLGIIGVQSTLAFAIPCKSAVAQESADEGCPDCPDDESDCPCPLPCPGCTGHAYAVPPPSPVGLVPSAPLATRVALSIVDRGPPSVPPNDILHVPKPV